MRIGMIAPIAERVPPKKYGGTERVVFHLVEELVRLGHQVTLFASGDSVTSAELVSVYPTALRESGLNDIYGYNTYSVLNTGVAYEMQNEFDVIHDHNPHMGLPTANIATVPVVMTWHGPYAKEIVGLFSRLRNPYFVSISQSQGRPVAHLPNYLGTVYNGLNMEDYPIQKKRKDYLLFVGRISQEKGVHMAIDAAVKAQRPLVIAAKLDDVITDQKYYYDQIKPRLARHSGLVEWIGEVDESRRNKLMSEAYCFLHPVDWPEPFGLVLIESMACGSPVVALRQGSIPEIVRHGETGFIADDVEGMVAAICKIPKIDRAFCRSYALTQFSAKRMTSRYLDIYHQAMILKSQTITKSAHDSSKRRQKIFFGFGPANA